MTETPDVECAHAGRALREAQQADIDAILVPIDAICRRHPWSRALFERELANSSAEVRVLEVDGSPVGFVVTWWVCDEVEIHNICVGPESRRQGHAEWMIASVVSAARSRGASLLRLEVRASNGAALSLYRQCGFSELARRRGYYSDNGEDAILLGFTLEPSPSGC